jgi:YVTN family beta-propeller protein
VYLSSGLVIDTATNTVVDTVQPLTFGRGIAMHSAGTRGYVANHFSDTVSAIDTVTHTVVDTIAVGNAPTAEGLFIGPTLSTCLGTDPRSRGGTVKRKAGTVNPGTTLRLNGPG